MRHRRSLGSTFFNHFKVRQAKALHLGLCILACYLTVGSMAPSLHFLVGCRWSPYNGSYVIEQGMKILHAQVEVPFREFNVPAGGSFEWDAAEVRIRQGCPMPSDSVPERATSTVWCIWHQPTYQLIVASFSESNGEFYGVDTVPSGAFQPLDCWSVPYEATWNGRKNVTEFLAFSDYLLKTYGRNRDEKSRAAVLQEIDHECWYHVSHPFADGKNGGRIFLGILIFLYEFCFIFGAFYARNQQYRSALDYRRHLANQGWRVRRPSLLRFFLKLRKTDADFHYRRRVDEQIRRRRNASRQAKRSQKQETALNQRRDQLREALKALAGQLVQQPDLDHEFRAAFDAAQDESLRIDERYGAYWQARSILAESSGRAPEGAPSVTSSHLAELKVQVSLVNIPSLPRSKRKAVAQLLERARTSQKVSVQLYCYEHALALVAEVDEAAVPVSAVERQQVSAVDTHTNGNTVVTGESDWILQLGIAEFVPPEVDHLHVATILISGLLKPGQIGRSYFNKRYRTAQYVHSDVQSKLGSRFNPFRYQGALDWLIAEGIVFSPKKINNQPVYSLNPHDNPKTAKRKAKVQLSETGSAVVSRILLFKHHQATATSSQ